MWSQVRAIKAVPLRKGEADILEAISSSSEGNGRVLAMVSALKIDIYILLLFWGLD